MATETKKKVEEKDEELVDLYIERTYDPEIDKQPVFFSFNFKNYLIKRGEHVKVPKGVKNIYENTVKAKVAAAEYAEKMKLKEA